MTSLSRDRKQWSVTSRSGGPLAGAVGGAVHDGRMVLARNMGHRPATALVSPVEFVNRTSWLAAPSIALHQGLACLNMGRKTKML